MSAPDVSVIIVSFQVNTLLERCLGSLERLTVPQLEVIVVDNASADGSCEMVRMKFPRVRLIANPENSGFAKANNQGLNTASGRYWMLLNPDTEISETDRNPLQILLAFMEAHPRVGVCGASLFYPDGTRQHSAFRFPTLAQIYMDLNPVNWRLRESRLNGRYPFSLYERGEPFQVDHPLGAAMLVRPAAVREVGMLDEAYFIYAEEVDWCMRMRQAGWEVWCVPQARITHHEAQSTRQFRGEMFVALWRARFILFQKHYSRAYNLAARALVRQGMLRAEREVTRQAARGEVTQRELVERFESYRSVAELAGK